MTSLLCAIFFASGLSALIFETLWFRQAGLAFGNSVWASSLVLSGFMAGLALGNALAARAGDRLRNPFRTYALAEAAIAITGVGLVFLFPSLGDVIAPWLRPLLDRWWLLNPLRLLIAFVVLVIPSTAMGLTLPLLTSTLLSYDRHFGPVLGRLYGWNTLGAVAGVIAGETVLVGALGIRGTAMAAGALNLLAAAVAAWLSTPSKSDQVGGSTLSTSLGVQDPPYDRRRVAAVAARPRSAPVCAPALPADQATTWNRRTWLVAAFLSGFSLLALEVIWFRVLLLVVMGTSLAFALMLGVVLSGIAAGGLSASVWLRRVPESFRWGGAVAFLAGLAGVVSYAVFPLALTRFESHLIVKPVEILVVGLPLMLPVSLLSGMLFTMAGAALHGVHDPETGGRRDVRTRKHGESATEVTGTLTLANTAGAALGSLAGGFVFLPVLGMERSFFAVMLVYAAIGGMLLWHRSARGGPAYASAAALLAGLLLFPFGTAESRLFQISVKRYAALRGGNVATITATREGRTETIIYLQVPTPVGPLFHSMYTNAISMADTEHVSRRYMKLYVYWPLAVHPSAKRALLIAYGVGNTAKALTDSRGLEGIDVVDISRDVLDMNRVVYPRDEDRPLNDPRVHVHIEDGRYFLQATDQRFDLITSEPPPPQSAGVVNLYTREYFQLLHDRLADGGVVAYWHPLHALSEVASKAILRAFCDVFEDCSLWNGIGSQLMMIGTRNLRGPVSGAQFAAQWNDRAVATEMRALGFERPEQLGALFIGDADYLKTLLAGVRPLVDDDPKVIEGKVQSPAEAVRLGVGFTDASAARERFRRSPLISRLWPPEMIAASLPYFDFQDMINRLGFGLPTAMQDVHRALTGSTLKTLPLWMMGSNADFQRVLTKADPALLGEASMQLHLGVRLLAERSYAAAVGPLSRAQAMDGGRRETIVGLRLYALCMSGQTGEAARVAAERADHLPAYWPWLKATFGL